VAQPTRDGDHHWYSAADTSSLRTLTGAGNFLELVVLDRSQGPAVIHAMPMTAQYRNLLPEG
jgi:hypothetical protein